MAEKNPLELFLFTDEPVRDLEHDHFSLTPFSSMVAVPWRVSGIIGLSGGNRAVIYRGITRTGK